MNATVVCEREIDEVSFRSAWDMSRACRPMWASPISPSSSARGTSAATESITMMSTAPLRTRVSGGPQLHDGSFAELLFDLGDRQFHVALLFFPLGHRVLL